jgi:hypothetical protein
MLEILIVFFAIASFFSTMLLWVIIKGGTRNPDEWIYPSKFVDEMEIDMMMDEACQVNMKTHYENLSVVKDISNSKIVH